MFPLQNLKIVPASYVVTLDDHGYVLLALGPVTFSFGLLEGFYVTIYNYVGATVTMTVMGGGVVRTSTGISTLSLINTSVTVLKLPGNNDFATFGSL